MTDKATLEEIEALVAGRTPSPWVIRDDGQSYAMPIIDSPNVGKGYFASIGHATQRDPNPVYGGGISIQTATANGHLMAHAPRLLEIAQEMRARLAEWESFREQFEGLSYHHSGMGCGIEDRGITDRYAACEHGWEAAMERVAERLPEA